MPDHYPYPPPADDDFGFSPAQADVPCVNVCLTPRHAALITQSIAMTVSKIATEYANHPDLAGVLMHCSSINAQISDAAFGVMAEGFADAADADFARLLEGGSANA